MNNVFENILLTSVCLTLLALIVVNVILKEHGIENKDYVKAFLYILPAFVTALSYFKQVTLKAAGKIDPATNSVFKEVSDSQKINGIMGLQGLFGGSDELIIDNIPKSITCNNIA